MKTKKKKVGAIKEKIRERFAHVDTSTTAGIRKPKSGKGI